MIVREKTIEKRPLVIGEGELKTIDPRYVNVDGDTMTGGIIYDVNAGVKIASVKTLGTERGFVQAADTGLIIAATYPHNLFFDATDFARFTGKIVPGEDNTIDFGTSSLRWRDGYFGGNVSMGSFSSGGGSMAGTYNLLAGGNLRVLGASKIDFQGGTVTGSGNIVSTDWNPSAHNRYDLGRPGHKWKLVAAVTTNFGDIGFSDESCSNCGKPFEVGQRVVLRVREVRELPEEEGGGVVVNTAPVHEVCPA